LKSAAVVSPRKSEELFIFDFAFCRLCGEPTTRCSEQRRKRCRRSSIQPIEEIAMQAVIARPCAPLRHDRRLSRNERLSRTPFSNRNSSCRWLETSPGTKESGS
jgi:hypothetical protein